jgi:hydrogenase maturation protein HypF
MLPNNPMQMLLAHRFGQPMVVTSSNDSGEPMLIDDEQAIERFGSEVDAILQHDRGIEQRGALQGILLGEVGADEQLAFCRNLLPAGVEISDL